MGMWAVSQKKYNHPKKGPLSFTETKNSNGTKRPLWMREKKGLLLIIGNVNGKF